MRPMNLAAVAVAAMLGLAACSGRTVGMTAITAPPTSGIPDCGTGQKLVDRPVFAVGVSAEGRVCWETALTRPPTNSHTFSAPLVGDGTAFLDADGQVFAVNLSDGLLRWRWDTGAPVDTSGEGGGGDATVAAEDGVIVAEKGAAGSDVVGLSDWTGAILWRRVKPAGFLVAATGTGDGGIVFSGDDGSGTVVINDGNGSVRWRHRSPPSPPAGRVMEVFGSLTPVAGRLIETTPKGSIIAVSSATGAVSWRHGGDTNEVTTSAGLLFVTPPPGTPPHYDVDTTALDPATGDRLWSVGPFDPGGSEFSAVSGILLHAESGPSGGTFARLDPTTGGTVWQVPVQIYATGGAGGVVADVETTGYQSGSESIVGRNRSTGALLWSTPLPLSPISYTTLRTVQGANGPVLVLVEPNTLTGFNPFSGRQEWEVTLPTDTTMDGLVTTADGMVVQVSGEAYAIQGH